MCCGEQGRIRRSLGITIFMRLYFLPSALLWIMDIKIVVNGNVIQVDQVDAIISYSNSLFTSYLTLSIRSYIQKEFRTDIRL